MSADLAFIHSHVAFLPAAITRLEERGLSLHDQIALIDDVRCKLRKIPGTRGSTLNKKSDSVFSKNKGFVTLHDLDQALLDGSTISDVSTDPTVLSSYTYAPIVSVDVERSFSEYKLILTDKRHNLKQENLEKYLIVMHNKRYL